MPKVLITGAAGFLGTRLARGLAEAGYAVTGLDRSPPKPLGDPPFTDFIVRDLGDEVNGAPSADSFPVVVHLAGLLPGKAPRRQLFAVNAGGTSVVVDRYVEPKGRLILFSTGLVYGDQPGPFVESMPCLAMDPYGQSKLAAEAVARAGCLAKGAALAVLRPSIAYGQGAPASMFLGALLASLERGDPFDMTAGEQWRDFLHVDDLVDAVLTLVEHGGEGTWNLSSGESLTLREVAGMAAAIARRPDLLRLNALPYREQEVFDYRLDSHAFQEHFGWRARIGLREGLLGLWKGLS